MPSTLKKLEDEALKLPPRSRARLAERLIASLQEETADTEADNAWSAEAQRRADELADGKVSGIPAETVFARTRSALR
jgi:putative addiction module component (TIGR02574 family)